MGPVFLPAGAKPRGRVQGEAWKGVLPVNANAGVEVQSEAKAEG
jgi:hypothetical protein